VADRTGSLVSDAASAPHPIVAVPRRSDAGPHRIRSGSGWRRTTRRRSAASAVVWR
jgi:hypothetical protein